MKLNQQFLDFNRAMDTILKADPKAVRDAMEADKEERANQRKAKLEAMPSKNSRRPAL